MKPGAPCTLSLIAVVGASFIACCSGQTDMVHKFVGSWSFDMPEKHVVTNDFPFLPASQNDGLTFVLDPEAERPKHILVAVDTAADVCNRPGKPVVDMVPRACAVAEGRAQAAPLGTLWKQLRFPDDDTQWDYHAENGGVVAMCTTGRNGGSCGSSFAWHDLIVSVSFDGAQIGQLDGLQRRIGELLRDWSAAG